MVTLTEVPNDWGFLSFLINTLILPFPATDGKCKFGRFGFQVARLSWWNTGGVIQNSGRMPIVWGHPMMNKVHSILLGGLKTPNAWVAVDGSEIPRPTTWHIFQTWLKNGITYQPQLVQDFSHQQYHDI